MRLIELEGPSRVTPSDLANAFACVLGRPVHAVPVPRESWNAIFRSQDMAFADALDFLRAQLALAFATEDIQEGVAAFFEKREPRWKGR